MAAPDRLEKLLAQSKVTGIDFVYVHQSQTLLDVYFHRDPTTLDDPLSNNLGEVVIYSPSNVVGNIVGTSLGIVSVDGRPVLRIQTQLPVTFAMYNLVINDARIDPYFNDVTFTFKANCPSDLDCKHGDHLCGEDEVIDFPVDYSARDFWSYRRALLEFADIRYPRWQDRLAADAGIMLTEVMSAVGDEMAYYQDRIGREGYLETATQRRSIRQHSALVDYPIHSGLGAFAWIQVTAKAPGNILAGANIWTMESNGTRIDFEIGNNLQEAIAKKRYYVDGNRNTLVIHSWDEDQVCLAIETTEIFLKGHQAIHLLNFDGALPNGDNGKWVLLKTTPVNPAQAARAWMVRVILVEEMMDPVFIEPITRIVWDEKQALPFELDMTSLKVHANMLPATSGLTHWQYFITGAEVTSLPANALTQLKLIAASKNARIIRAIEREGNDGAIAYLCSLWGTVERNPVWLGPDWKRSSPEIQMDEIVFNITQWEIDTEWLWRSSFIGVNSSASQDNHYVLDDGSWGRIAGFWRNGKEIVHEDYSTGGGATIRFGNGEFGLTPAEETVFQVQYRLGGGTTANVAPDTIVNFHTADFLFVERIANPLSAFGGEDPESSTVIKGSAPEEFRQITYRAVREEDYAEAIERLPWVQKAGASFRWTGSWLTVFATPDPKNSVVLRDEWRNEMQRQLDRFRQAGREAYSMDPVYADIDLEIEVCASHEVYPGELEERIMIRLLGRKGFLPVPGFFSPDRFTFGDPLERSQLEGAIMEVEGVKAVEYIRFRRRGLFEWKFFTDFMYDPGKNSIIRLENDPLHPERGILTLNIHGGA